jgi:hypothetical protein
MVAGKRVRSDTRLNVARYQVDRITGDDAEADAAEPQNEPDNAGQPTMEQRAQFVEISIQQAIRRGDFDNLPGAGKPLRNLHLTHDPNWWIRQKIDSERLTGLGPPALTLRTENAALDTRLDALATEQRVRELLDEFNRRVIDARRQLQGGPPVVTPTRDVDEELERWRDRRAARLRSLQEAREREAAVWAAMTRRERRRTKRAARRGE